MDLTKIFADTPAQVNRGRVPDDSGGARSRARARAEGGMRAVGYFSRDFRFFVIRRNLLI
jgi:hypothetical protein